jgi:hypothetical protein
VLLGRDLVVLPGKNEQLYVERRLTVPQPHSWYMFYSQTPSMFICFLFLFELDGRLLVLASQSFSFL